jgi:hypothetical protein
VVPVVLHPLPVVLGLLLVPPLKPLLPKKRRKSPLRSRMKMYFSPQFLEQFLIFNL